MLILTRRIGESVIIGDDVTFTILGVRGNQVRVGINAPDTVAVHREEIYLRIKQEEAEKMRNKLKRTRQELADTEESDGTSDEENHNNDKY